MTMRQYRHGSRVPSVRLWVSSGIGGTGSTWHAGKSSCPSSPMSSASAGITSSQDVSSRPRCTGAGASNRLAISAHSALSMEKVAERKMPNVHAIAR